jgi:tetratricopeptide (TPR) repeat protein
MKEFINWHESAEIYSRAEMYDAAIACYDYAIERNPLDEVAWVRKGYICFILDKNNEELQCYDKTLEINPKNGVVI